MRSRILYVSSLVASTLCSFACDRQPESPALVVSADGVPIRYEVHGSGEPALVFVHGWSCDRSYWDAQVPHFSESYRVVTIDLAGHGESGQNRGEWTVAAFAEDVAAVVNELDLEQVVMVGHSMGAAVVVEASRRVSDRVIGLVAVDMFLDIDTSMTPAEIEESLAPLVEDFAGTTAEAVSAYSSVPESDPVLIGWIAEDMSSAPPGPAVEALRNLRAWEARDPDETLGQVQVPMRAIHADKYPTNVDALSRYGIDVILMSGVGHFVMMEDPETFNRLLGEIVKSLQDD